MLIMDLRAQEGTEIWKKDIDPLMESKYLFIPHRYSNQDSIKEHGCCMQEGTN